ncbi:MAG: hypothetical protein WC005_01755 [Candidatus Nanopelagicales bacterium]
MSSPLDRYRLVEQLLVPDSNAVYWRGYDLTLDREVVIRTLVATDPRANALREAARSSALIEDRRLIRVLDVIDVPATDAQPALIAIINEWVEGHTLASIMRGRDWQPLDADQAVGIVTEVAQALEISHHLRIRHGRLLPTSVVMTDAAEVRIIGMCVDAALLGSAHDDLIRCDVDALGGLLYFLLTGRSPFADALVQSPADPEHLRAAPRHRSHLEPASHVRADVPHELDVLISRSMIELRRPRGTTKLRTIEEFLQALNRIRDEVDPVAVATSSNRATMWLVRVVIAIAAIAGIGLLVVAWRQLFVGPDVGRPQATQSAPVQAPIEPTATAVPSVRLPVVAVTSFDPFGDDNGDGAADGSSGREHQGIAALAVDRQSTTTWKSQRYASADADGKGGVGLILDLGQSHLVSAVRVRFDGLGTSVRIGVADTVLDDPAQWPLLTQAPAGRASVTLRAARPLAGQYVLVWFPRLPSIIDRPRIHQVRVSEMIVRGAH